MNKMLTISIVASISTALFGCSTPLEDCNSRATKDLRTLRSAISETSGNIGRGYAVHNQSVPYTYQGSCWSYQYQTYYSCAQNGYRNQSTPVSINVNQERQKLADLKRLLPRYEAQANSALKQCNAQYPEKS